MEQEVWQRDVKREVETDSGGEIWRMAPEIKEETGEAQKEIPHRRMIWLQCFLNPEGKTADGQRTFLNKTTSTIAAGFNCKNRNSFRVLGQKIWNSVEPIVDRLLEEAGVTEESIKFKLAKLMNAKKTIYFVHEGEVKDERTVPALEVQLEAVKLAARIMGLLSGKTIVMASDDKADGYVLPIEARDLLGDILDPPPEDKVKSSVSEPQKTDRRDLS